MFSISAWEPLKLSHLTRVVEVTNDTDNGIIFHLLHVLWAR